MADTQKCVSAVASSERGRDCHTPWTHSGAMRLHREILELAGDQRGLVGRWQLQALGASDTEVDRLSRSPGWEPASQRVLARTGMGWSDRRRLQLAVLDASPGAWLGGSTAAWLWGAPGYRPDPIHLVRHRGVSRRAPAFGVVHEVTHVLPSEVKMLDGLPLLGPALVVCELAGMTPAAKVERTLDWFWNNRLLDGRTFRAVVSRYARRGRAGSSVLRELDAKRGPGYVPPASNLERRFEEVLDRYGQPRMRRQVDSGGEAWSGRVDFRDEHLPLVVEVQSERFHSALVDKVADAHRKEALVAAGFRIVEVWDTEVWYHPGSVAERVAEARSELRQRPAA